MTNESQLFAGEQLYIYVDPDVVFTPTHSTFADVVLKHLAKHEKQHVVGLNNFPLLTETPFHGNHHKFPGCIPDAKLPCRVF